MDPAVLKQLAETLAWRRRQMQPGNIDLSTRPRVSNPDGTFSTIRSMSAGFGDGEYLFPTLSPSGQQLSPEQAIELFKTTGQHLGQFTTPEAATLYAKWLSAQQGEK